jgi:POT family proton-dependent oligopeptide transporter
MTNFSSIFSVISSYSVLSKSFNKLATSTINTAYCIRTYIKIKTNCFQGIIMTIETNNDRSFVGHPMGLLTLAGTEMWERMSYYGMRALLVLFMVLAIEDGGMGLTVATASAIYGLYTGAVYFFGLPGGWIADRLIGGQKAVFYGGIVIMIGHIILAIPSDSTFFFGLIFVVLGTGLLKPNIGAMVGQLYSPTDSRRDSAYTIYYMGINIGSLIG